MDIKKALEIMEIWKAFRGQRITNDFDKNLDCIRQFVEELQQYRQVGTIEQCRSAVERRTSLPVMINGGVYKCPSCGTGRSVKHRYNYCPKCGQSIDWKQK